MFYIYNNHMYYQKQQRWVHMLKYRFSALDKLLGQLGIYATWLSSIEYLQKQLRIFYIFFTQRFGQ